MRSAGCSILLGSAIGGPHGDWIPPRSVCPHDPPSPHGGLGVSTPAAPGAAPLWGSAPGPGCLPLAAGRPASRVLLVVVVRCHGVQQLPEGLLAQWAGLCQFGPFTDTDKAEAMLAHLHIGGVFQVTQADGA